MPIDPIQTMTAVQEAVGHVPAAVGAVVLLGGPTALWLFWRFIVQPRRSRYPIGRSDLLWLCARCQSANEVRSSRCYRCGMRRDAIEDLRLYDGQGFVTLPSEDADVEPALGPASVTASIATSQGPAAAPDLAAVGAIQVSEIMAMAAAGSADPVGEWDADPVDEWGADPAMDAEPELGLADVLPAEPAGPAAVPPRRLVAVGPGHTPMAPEPSVPPVVEAAPAPVPVMDEAARTAGPNGFRRRYASIAAGEAVGSADDEPAEVRPPRAS